MYVFALCAVLNKVVFITIAMKIIVCWLHCMNPELLVLVSLPCQVAFRGSVLFN